jgi:SAM-dependent methyltransferase
MSLQLTLVAIGLATLSGTPSASRHAHLRMLAGGFGKGGRGGRGKGAGSKGKGGSGGFGRPAQVATELDVDVAAVLERSGGDLDVAQSTFFRESVRRLQQEEPELYALMQRPPASPTSHSSSEVHEKLVELTWDTIAAFMAQGSDPPNRVKRRLRLVAEAACKSPGRPSGDRGPSILDVGCGDGAALPFLCAAGADEARYVGLDLSTRMIRSAKQTRGGRGAMFERGSFLSSRLAAPPAAYDAVLFNGAFQFFTDQEEALRRAAALVPRVGGRVVLAHINGAAFVRDEARGNPTTVPSVMPELVWLDARSKVLGMAVVGPAELGVELGDGGDAEALDSFYLVALQRVQPPETVQTDRL